MMQNAEQKESNDLNKEVKKVEVEQGSQTSVQSSTSDENVILETPQSNFSQEISCSDDEEVSEVDSFSLDQDLDERDQVLEPSFLLSRETIEGANLQTVTVDPETHARLEALLEAAGIGKLSTADGKALTDPDVLRKLTSSVSCALDEAAQALHRMRAEQQGQLGSMDSSRSLAEACSDGDVPTVRKLLREGGSVHETTEEGDSLLSLACSAGYYELAQVLLAMKANVEDRGIKGDCTPLMEAASGGYVDIVRLLIKHGADVNAQSSAGNTPLHYAACGGYEDVVQVLIDNGANVEQHNENGHTPLMEAASAGHVGVARLLLQAGAGINTHSNEFKESALTLACYKGHLEMVKFLLEAGADQEHKTDEMHTALMEASMDGHVEVARLLLDSGAQVNMPADSFESPLTLAACGGHVELANLLIERGANLEEVNDEGYTPLMEAAREGHEEMVALLLAHGADINAQTEETQETALTLACCGGFLDVADFLIKAGADIELGCSTPLMEAAQEGHLELVKYLLKANAIVHAQTGTGDTALTYACENGHTDVAEVLLERGAELEHESEGGRTPLMKAARAGHQCTVQFLISKGADVNRQTSTNDHTVLSLACAGGHLSVVELLLAHGADPTHKLKDGSTMVIEAAKGGHTQVVKLLLEYPNRMLMSPSPDVPQLNHAESHLVEARVPVHGLAHIVPPSEPDSHVKPNNLTTTSVCDQSASPGAKRKTTEKDFNIPPKTTEQIWQNMQKSITKRTVSGGSANCGSDASNKGSRTSSFTSTGSDLMCGENGLHDLIADESVDLKAGERLEAIISNVMAKELINTTTTREEQILRKQQILEELQKVERELQEKAQAQLLLSAQHHSEQQQQQQQLQQVLQQQGNKPLHKVLHKQLEEQVKRKRESTHSDVISSPVVSSSSLDLISGDTSQMSNNLDKQGTRTSSGDQQSNGMVKPNICAGVSSGPANPFVASINDLQSQNEEVLEANKGNLSNKAGTKRKNTKNEGNFQKSNGGHLSVNGGFLSSEQYNSGSQSQQPAPSPALPLQPSLQQHVPPPPPPLQSLPQQQLQLQHQLQQLQQQHQFQQQQQQQTVINPPLMLNESQRQHLQNLILRQQQEAQQQQLAQQATPLQFPQLQLTPQQQDQLLQMLSQQTLPQAFGQQQVPSQQPLQQQQQQQTLQQLLPQAPISPQVLTQQQQQQLLQQQQQAQYLQQQLQQIKPPANLQKQVKNKKHLLNNQLGNPDSGLGIETVTPPPSTPMTPNPSPVSPQTISPLYAPIDLDAQTESNHDTALTLACAGGHAELVQLLLSKNADIEHRDKKGFTPLILAATAGHVDVVEILLEHNADIEAQSERTKDTPLSLACSGGRYEVVELLLSRSANKEHRNVSDYTPLSLAASGGYVNIIKLLLSHGAEINSRTGSKLGISPLMLAAMNGHTAAVKLLLDMGSDINAQIETNRNTALTLACFQGRHEVVSLLVDRKANIEHRAKTGLTPLMEAASGGYVEVGRVLLDKGADVNAPPVPSSRDTALTIAADKGHYRFVELLLQRCAAVDVKNKKGNSPLWLACNGGHLDVVQLLVSYKADIDSQDNRKVSCLMASFRKGHVKVVKWMVKHVTQFPSDQDLSRYIATVADKELQKKCQQCMEIIVSAKDRQAAEANKNASILLEELDKERQQEESRRAAAAKKRERKKKKKKEKQQEQGGDKETSKTSSPEPESEDSNSKEEMKENMMTSMNIEEAENRVPLAPPTATTTSTLGLTLPTTSEAKYSKPSKNRNSKLNKEEQNIITVESKKNLQNRKEKEKSRPQDTKSDHLGLGMTSTSTPTTVATLSVSTVVMTVASNDDPGNKGTSYLKGRTEVLGPASSGNAKKKKDDLKSLGSTGIGDLDDFGSLPEISDRDIEKLRKSVEKTKLSHGNSGSTLQSSPQAGEKTIMISDMNPNMLSVKSSTLVTNSPKRGQKKEEDWKEVIRRSKKVQVPASAISRVIGRGGCNINAIREVSGAHIEVEKNRGSGERVITIKGSADATRQAHALITALVQDPDKDLQELLPKNKSGSSSSSSSSSKSDKSLYFIPPPEVYSSGNGPISQQSGNQSKSTINNKSVGPRLQQAFSGGTQGSNGRTSQNQVWGNSSSGLISPRRAKQQNSSANFSLPATPGSSNDKSVSRQLFLNEKKCFTGLVQTSTNATVTYSQTSSGTRTSPSSSPIATGRPDLRQPTPNRAGKQLIPGTVRVLQRPSTVSLKHEPQPLPIVSNQSTTITSTSASSVGLQPGGSIPVSVPGEFSPFDNLLSNVAEHFLGKKEDSERMNFASVAAAGVVSILPGSTAVSSTPPPTNHIDPALQAKAPGFKLPGPRMTGSQDQEFQMPPRVPGAFSAGYQMPPPPMMLNNFEMPRMPGVYQPAQYPVMFHPSHSNSTTPPSHSPRGGPGAEGRGGQMSTADQSQLSSPSMSSVSSLKDEYTTPNQPMTLPKISSTLNPNAPDFTSRSSTTMMSGGPHGPSFGPGQGGPINIPMIENFPTIPPANLQALYQQAFTQQLISAFNNFGPPNNFGPNLNQGPGPSPSPGSIGSQEGMRNSISHQELYQNVANLMHQIALQNGGMGLGGPNPGPAQGFVPPHSMARPYSPLTAQGRPSSAPSIGVLAKEGSSPSLGHPSSSSPLPPSTPPLESLMRGGEDRRQLRPIGGERAAQRKAPGPAMSIGSGHNSMEDLGPPFWNLSPDFNMEWTPKSSIGLSVSSVPPSVPVVTSSVISGGSMMSAAGDGRQVGMDNHSSSHFEDGLGEQSYGPNVQQPPHQQMPLFNSVGGQFSMGGQGQSYQTGTMGAGEGPADMWNHMDSTPVSDIQDKGVSEPKKMWNSWSGK